MEIYITFSKKPPTESSASFTNVLDKVSNNMSNKLLFGLPNPTLDSEAVSLGYLKTHVFGTLFNTLLWEYFINHSKCTYRIDRAIIN